MSYWAGLVEEAVELEIPGRSMMASVVLNWSGFGSRAVEEELA